MQTSIDNATREAGVMFYGTGSYGFYGYAFADLGEKFDFVHTSVLIPLIYPVFVSWDDQDGEGHGV